MSKETKALAGLPMGGQRESYSSRSVRKIDNGYIVCDYGGDGRAKERFTENPEDNAPRKVGPDEHKGSLAEAAQYLKR